MEGTIKLQHLLGKARKNFPLVLLISIAVTLLTFRFVRNFTIVFLALSLMNVLLLLFLAVNGWEKAIEYKNGLKAYLKYLRELIAVDKDRYPSRKLDALKAVMRNKAERSEREAFIHNAGRLFDVRQEIKAEISMAASANVKYVFLTSFITFGVFFALLFLLSMPPLHKVSDIWVAHLFWIGLTVTSLPGLIFWNVYARHMPIDASSRFYEKARGEFIEAMLEKQFRTEEAQP